jgi:hypothetical protein
MRITRVSLVMLAALISQVPSRAAGPRVAPVPENQRSGEQQSLAARFASSAMPNLVATYIHHPALAKSLDTKQLLDVLIAVGGYRSTSMVISSAGVQLDANMADFRFPPSLR